MNYNFFKRSSIAIVLLPYIAFSLKLLTQSSYTTFTAVTFFLIILLSIELIYRHITKSNRLFNVILSILTISVIVTFFYGQLIVSSATNSFMSSSKLMNFRQRDSILYLLIFLILIQIILIKKRHFYNILTNMFCVVLFLSNLSLFAYNKLSPQKNKTEIQQSNSFLINNNTTAKPLLFILTDEYSSPDELFKLYKDSSIYNFSDSLTKTGWTVKKSFNTSCAATASVFSSIMNFNLSKKDSSFRKLETTNLVMKYLMNPGLCDSLRSKNVNFINFGIFDFYDHKSLTPLYPETRLYHFPKNFAELFLYKSLFCYVFYKSANFKPYGLNNSIFPSELHNKFIFSKLSDSVSKATKNTFVYAHFFMPHPPFIFTPEFPFRPITTDNYYSYWKFSNIKLAELLKKLTKENKYRIIITGDHGFRGDDKINPLKTFSAYWGFEKSDIDNVEAVDDIGLLINAYLH